MPRSYDLRAARLEGLHQPFAPDVGIREASDDLIRGRLNLGFADLPKPDFGTPMDEDFWSSFAENHGNTFALYLCGLRPVRLLAAAAIAERNHDYLRLADAFVASFVVQAAGPRPADMAFNDHAIAERIENLTALLHAATEVGHDLESNDQIAELVREDALRLLDRAYYQVGHNHGIIADRAVILAAILLQADDAETWIDQAARRLRHQVAHAFGPDGVHSENSFDYHLTVTRLLANCAKILRLLEHPYAAELAEALGKSSEFVVHALKPDLTTPLFGDSKPLADGTKRSGPNLTAFSDSAQHIAYITSKGTTGERPDVLFKHFPSGYAFIRSSFEPEDYESATWISLRAGSTTRVHRQRDDLAVGLYSKGHDIFIDSGMNDYTPHDPVTRHMASIAAHTTTAVEGKGHTLAAATGRKFRIVAARPGPIWDYVAASNHAIAGVAIYRHLYYLRELDVLVIHDEFIAERPHTYLQYFKLSPEVSLVAPGGEGLTLAIGATGFVADLVQLAGYDRLELSAGRSGAPMSVVSTGFGTVRPTQTLTYRATGETLDLITVVGIRDAKAEPVALALAEGHIAVGPVELPRVRSAPPRFHGSRVSAAGTAIEVTNERGPGAATFAVHAFALHDGSILCRHDYTSAPSITIDNPDRVDCALVYFVRNAQYDRTEGVLALCRYGPHGVEIFTYNSLHSPVVDGATCRAITDDEFEFAVELRYDLPATFRWWVYRNGANVRHDPSGERVARFTFDRPGSYVVMCSVVDPLFGESWFEQFDPITL